MPAFVSGDGIRGLEIHVLECQVQLNGVESLCPDPLGGFLKRIREIAGEDSCLNHGKFLLPDCTKPLSDSCLKFSKQNSAPVFHRTIAGLDQSHRPEVEIG